MNGEQYTAMSVFNQLCFSRTRMAGPVYMFKFIATSPLDIAFNQEDSQELITS